MKHLYTYKIFETLDKETELYPLFTNFIDELEVIIYTYNETS